MNIITPRPALVYQTNNVSRTNINNTYKQYNGRYITYFKSILQLRGLFKQLHKLEKYINIPKWKRIWINIVMGIQFLLQLIFKPLLCIFHTNRFYDLSEYTFQYLFLFC